MLWRITAAITAIYFMHGADQSRQDAVQAASAMAAEAPRALVNACLDQHDLCQQILRHAGGSARTDSTPHTGMVSPMPAQKTLQVPVADEFPLPPVRPAMLPGRKGT